MAAPRRDARLCANEGAVLAAQRPDNLSVPSAVCAYARTSGLYLIRCGSSASGPRVSVTHSAYWAHVPSNQVTCDSPSNARMCVATCRNIYVAVLVSGKAAANSLLNEVGALAGNVFALAMAGGMSPCKTG